MVDKIEKFLKKVPKKQYKVLIQIIEQILLGDISGLDVKHLKGYKDIFRVRKGQVRILFKRDGKKYRIISIENRSDTIYDL